MSKRLTRVLSLVLTLVMFLSVSTPAFAIGGGDMGRDFGRDIGENEIRDFEPAGEIAEEEELDYFQTTVEANGSQVTVEAPMGALPTLAELRAETVEIADVREAVDSVVEGETNILVAMDISFWLNGIEIEPEEPVRVKISAPELDGKDNLTLVHIPDAAEPETIDLIDEDQVSFALGSNEIAFQADSFSIYAVVEPAITPRLAYHFMSGTTEFNTQFVKKTDIIGEEDHHDDLYEPTIPANNGQVFIGWCIEDPTGANIVDFDEVIADSHIRIDALTAADDLKDVYVYAIYHEAYVLRYLRQESNGELAVLETKSVDKDDPVDEHFNVVLTQYVPAEGEHFQGWIDVKTGFIYNQNNTQDTINLKETGSIDLYLKLENYVWLVFDSNANGDSATYTPPQLLNTREDNKIPTQPADPVRTGYAFAGWKTQADGSGETWLKVEYDEEGNPRYSDNEEFAAELTEDTVLYAQWTPVMTDYTVVFWKQKVTATGTNPTTDYDFADSEVRHQLSGTDAQITNADQTKGGTAGSDYGYYFTYNEDNSDTEIKTVAGDGSTVLNVYYDRRTITYNFVYPTATTATYGRYGYVDGEYVQLYYETWTGGHSAVGNNDNHDTVYYRVAGYYGGYNYYEYTGTRYSGNSGTRTQSFSGLYQSAFTDWPNPGSGKVWKVQYLMPVALTTFDPQAAYTYAYNDTTVTFTLENYNSAITLHIYKQTVDGEWVYTDENILSSGLVSRTNTWYPTETFAGYTLDAYRLSANGTWTSVTPSGSIPYDGYLDLRYTRNQHDIIFISESEGSTGRDEHRVSNVYYEAPMSTYGQNEDGTWFYEPTNGKDGFYFAGWYEDAALSVEYKFNEKTMPDNNVTLYAKWETSRVRVVLVPTADNAHNDEVSFANNQALTFRLDYNEKISDANINSTTAKRNGYVLNGWYTDPDDPDSLWEFSTPVNKTIQAVDMNYQTSPDWTVYGDNDGKHQNVKGILKLYAKWRLADTNCVYVRYEVPDQYLVKAGTEVKTIIPYDTMKYYPNDEGVVPGIVMMGEPSNYVEGFIFQNWTLKDPNGGVSGTYPPNALAGNIPVSYIQEEEVTDDYGNEATLKYITFVATFAASENTNITTMVTFDGNGGLTKDNESSVSSVHRVNENLDILGADSFTREGCTLVGWSFYKNLTAEQYAQIKNGENVTVGDVTITKDDIFDPGTVAAADNLDKTLLNTKDNILYAIWDGAFFIYHSSTAKVEKIPLSALNAEGKYNIVAKTASGKLYGGYYSDYKDKGEYDLKNPQEGEFGTAYEGGLNIWLKDDALTESGFAMTPVMNHTYFLKEVPNTYLMPTQIETFNRYNFELRHLIFTTAIDDNNYKSNGFTVAGNNEDGARTPVVTLTFGANSEKDKVELEAKDVANVENGLVGFYCEFNSIDGGKHTELIAAKAMSVKPYWVTPDGVTVTGSGLRRVLIVDKNENSIVEVGTMAEVTYRNYKSAITAKAA